MKRLYLFGQKNDRLSVEEIIDFTYNPYLKFLDTTDSQDQMKLFVKSLLLTAALFSITTLPDLRGIADESHGHGQGHGEMDHSHQPMEVPSGQPVPQVDLVVHSDAVRGWNLEVKVSNFQFTPSQTNQADEISGGHAHLYINGEKVTRIYSNWYYLKNLEPGEHQVRVTLNTNGHKALYSQGLPIEDTEVIQVP